MTKQGPVARAGQLVLFAPARGGIVSQYIASTLGQRVLEFRAYQVSRAERREVLRKRQRRSRLAVPSLLETYLFCIVWREQKLSS